MPEIKFYLLCGPKFIKNFILGVFDYRMACSQSSALSQRQVVFMYTSGCRSEAYRLYSVVVASSPSLRLMNRGVRLPFVYGQPQMFEFSDFCLHFTDCCRWLMKLQIFDLGSECTCGYLGLALPLARSQHNRWQTRFPVQTYIRLFLAPMTFMAYGKIFFTCSVCDQCCCLPGMLDPWTVNYPQFYSGFV